MFTTNDPHPHETPPTEPHTPDENPAEQPRAQTALTWATVGLSAAFCTTGVVLSLTGHEEAGVALINAGTFGGGVSTRK
jgi:hypothetical protein